MSKTNSILFSLFFFFSMVGCVTSPNGGGNMISNIFSGNNASAQTVSPPVDLRELTKEEQAQLPWVNYSPVQPPIRIAIESFEDKTGATTTVDYSGGQAVISSNPIGNGMTDQIITALSGLKNAGAPFEIFEYRQGQASINFDYVYKGAVIGFMPSQQSMDAGIGFGALGGSFGGTGGIGILVEQLFKFATKKDYVALNIRVLDINDRIIDSVAVEGYASDFASSAGGIFGTTFLGVSGQSKTPIDKAVQVCLIRALGPLSTSIINDSQRRVANN